MMSALKGWDDLGNQPGLISLNGAALKETKRFTLKSLGENGFGKSDAMDAMISEEADALIDYLKGQGRTFKMHIKELFLVSVNNVIWRIVAGKRTRNIRDAKIVKLTEGITKVNI